VGGLIAAGSHRPLNAISMTLESVRLVCVEISTAATACSVLSSLEAAVTLAGGYPNQPGWIAPIYGLTVKRLAWSE
jgi:uncharacterized membrane protein